MSYARPCYKNPEKSPEIYPDYPLKKYVVKNLYFPKILANIFNNFQILDLMRTLACFRYVFQVIIIDKACNLQVS